MALLADAGHNLSDVLALTLAWGASTLAKRGPSERFTYGLRSSSILVALLNAALLLVQQCDEDRRAARSEEHTFELQSRGHLVCRLLLEKKDKLLNNPYVSRRLWPRLNSLRLLPVWI